MVTSDKKRSKNYNPITKIWKIVKMAFRGRKHKSADEKLRGIGKQPPGIKPTGPSGFEEPHEMAERRIQLRQGRRDNFRGNDATRGQQDIQQEKIEIKRRSRSEGPTRRVRQRDDKRVHQSDSFAKGDNVSRPNWDVEETSTATRVSRYSPPISDDGGFIRDAGSDSDSYDSDPKIWTKNQLMSRRSRRSGAHNDKRRSNINNDAHISTRDSFVYYSTTGQDKSDSSGTGGSFKGNKFQKIEERRKKRIDIQMTSDEENSPEYRISRLRQRALQSGLGRQTRIELPDTLSPSVFTQRNVPQNYQQNTRNSGAYSNTPLGANNNNNNYHNQRNQNVLSNSQGNFAPQTSTGYQHNNVQQRQYQQTTSKTTSSQQNTQQNSDPVPFGSPQTARVMTYGKLINNEPIRNPYSGVKSSDSGQVQRNNQSANFGIFKNSRTNSVDNTTSPTKNNRFVYNSSPEVGRKFDLSAARGSSIDSVYDTGVAPEPASRSGAFRRYNQHIGVTSGFQTGFSVDKDQKPVYVNPPSNQTMEVQRGSVVKYPVNSVQLQSSRSPRVNETCELRFDTNRLMEGPLSPVSPKEYRPFNRAHSEDSLDEIVMSNAQFLESNMGKARNNIKSQVPVSRSASLPDQKRQGLIQNRARGSAEIVVPFGYSKKPILQAAPYRHHMEKSELEIRVPMPGANKMTPEITIANENLNDPSDYSYNYNGNAMHMSTGFGAPRQERKLSYDSRSGYSRPTSQYFERDDISKSDSQLNTATVPPSTYRAEHLHPMSHYKQPKSLSADQLLPPGAMGVVHSRPTEAGMFSDVEYDIEVSDRIRKWETYMKKSNEPFSNGNALTTIQERTEEFGLTPYDNRRAAPRDIPRPVIITSSQSWNTVEPMTMKPSSSDPTVHLLGEPQIISHETNTHRLFQLVPSVRAQSTSNSMGTLIQSQAPIQSHNSAAKRSLPTLHYAFNMPETPLTAGKLKQKMIADRQSSLESSSTESPILSDKGSKYMRYQEIDDMTGSKDESVKDLCKLFNFNEDSEGRRIAKISPQKHNDDEWAKIISDMEDNIKKTDVWSPHMESTKGESLSIERVKARTLQTIPFQDDPFWKEIEEMTSFESLVGQKQGDQMASYDDQFIGHNQNQGDTSQSQSSTLPNQPRLTTSSRDRLQRSKSLYTPNIAPLTLGMPPRSHNSQTTLEDAIEDLKTSVDRTSTRDSLDSKSSSQTQSLSDFKVSAPVRSSMYIENVQMRDQPKKMWSQHRGSGVYDIPENVSVKDMYTFSTEPGQTFPNVVNGNYELDPNLLKHKLLSTGLVEENVDTFYNERQDSSDCGKQTPKYQETITATSKPAVNTAPQRFYQSEDKVNQVSQSMEDLRQLAKNVENKIELIKSKLVQADDTNLDKILVALRKFSPSAGPRSPEIRSETMHDFYQSKRSKLSDALTELERIYKNLDLENETLYDRADRRDYPSYHRLSPASLNNAPPIRETTSLSIEIASPVFNDRADVEKQTQSEFDAISKSFQAILDEVNQTSAVTTSSEDVWISGPQSTPDSPRLPMRVTLKSTQIPSPTSKSPNQSVSTVSDSDTPSRLRKSRQRFRSKIPDVVGDDVAVRKARSKSSPRIEATAVAPPSPTTADYLNPREMSAAKGRIRIRPEREPDVMHDDMAYRNLIQKETSENQKSTAKSSIQIELSSPESPQVKSELIFEPILIGDKKSKITQPVPPPVSPIPPSVSPIPSGTNVKHEPKIMGTAQHAGNQQRQIRSLQLGKTSSLPTKIQPKEIVTASKKVITVSQNKDKPEPVQIKTVNLVTLPKESASASSTAVSKTLVQQTKILPKDQSNKDNKGSSKVEANVELKSPLLGEIKPNSRVEIKIPLITKATTQKADNISEVNAGTNETKKPEMTGPVLKMPITKVQPPKLATAKLAKFLPASEQPKSKVVGPKVELSSCKDTKLRVPTKTPKVVPPGQKNIKTELKLATGNKTSNGRSNQDEKSPKLAEKEIIIKLPTAISSTVPDTATNSGKPNAENIPEKRTVETQTSPAKDKSTKSKQAERRQKYKKYGRGVAGMVDLFSSSDEDRHRATKPLLTRSAPDLSLLSLDDDDDHVDDDLVDDPTSKGTQAEITEDATDLDESDAVFTDDVAPVSPTQNTPNSVGMANSKDAKPPAHPSSVKNTNTPGTDKPRPSGDAKDKTSVNISVCSDIDKSVQLRRRHSLERTVIDDTDRDERPKSFHELLESFETNKTKKRIHRMRSLRKCVSEDAMITDMVVAKVYHSDLCLSEPDLSENSNRIPSKEGRVFLKVEMQIKS